MKSFSIALMLSLLTFAGCEDTTPKVGFSADQCQEYKNLIAKNTELRKDLANYVSVGGVYVAAMSDGIQRNYSEQIKENQTMVQQALNQVGKGCVFNVRVKIGRKYFMSKAICNELRGWRNELARTARDLATYGSAPQEDRAALVSFAKNFRDFLNSSLSSEFFLDLRYRVCGDNLF